MQTIYVMIGIAGSGKSTYAKQLAIQKQAVIISTDEIRKQLYGSETYLGNLNTIWNVAHSQANQYLKQGQSVIFDAVNIGGKRRKKLLNKLSYWKCPKICIFMDTPLNTCLKNNRTRERHVPESIIRRMANQLNVPTYEEGWTNIIHIK